eukprot:6209945-Pleurochrysis_carterae.AAC.2
MQGSHSHFALLESTQLIENGQERHRLRMFDRHCAFSAAVRACLRLHDKQSLRGAAVSFWKEPVHEVVAVEIGGERRSNRRIATYHSYGTVALFTTANRDPAAMLCYFRTRAIQPHSSEGATPAE